MPGRKGNPISDNSADRNEASRPVNTPPLDGAFGGYPPLNQQPDPEPTPAPSRRRRRWVWLGPSIAAVLVLVAIGLVVVVGVSARGH